MSTLHVIFGLSGWTKDNFANFYAKNKGELVEYIEFLYSVPDFCKDPKECAYKAMFKQVCGLLKSGKNVVLNTPCIKRKQRTRIINTIKQQCKNPVTYKCVILTSDQKHSLAYDADTLDEEVNAFSCPQFEEGWDKIEILKQSYLEDTDVLNKMYNFDQENRHHKYTLGAHCVDLASRYEVGDPRRYAGLWHDVGKLWTKQYDEEKQAHYFNHENWSVCWVLSHHKLVKDDLDVSNESDVKFFLDTLFYIEMHMIARDLEKSTSGEKRARKFWGDDKIDKLFEFAENDKKASGTYEEHNKLVKYKSKLTLQQLLYNITYATKCDDDTAAVIKNILLENID